MPLESAIDLVLFAFEHANGDLFIRKAPASTIPNLARLSNILYHRFLLDYRYQQVRNCMNLLHF